MSPGAAVDLSMMAARRQRHFLAIADLSIDELRDLLEFASSSSGAGQPGSRTSH